MRPCFLVVTDEVSLYALVLLLNQVAFMRSSYTASDNHTGDVCNNVNIYMYSCKAQYVAHILALPAVVVLVNSYIIDCT